VGPGSDLNPAAADFRRSGLPLPPPLSIPRAPGQSSSPSAGGAAPGYFIGEDRERYPQHMQAPLLPPSAGSGTPTHASQNQQLPIGSRRCSPASTPTHAQYMAARANMSLGGDARSSYFEAHGGEDRSQSEPYADPACYRPQQYPPAHRGPQQHPSYRGASPSHYQQQHHHQQQQQQQAHHGSPRYGDVPQSPHHHQPQQLNSHYGHQHQASYHQQQQLAHGPHYGAGTSAMPSAPPDLIYQVQFKRGVRSFTLSPRANFTVRERDFVVVEADRGEDIGIVVEVLPMHAFMERRMNMPRPSAQQQQQDGEDQNVCCILRLATLHERQQLPDKFHTEKDIVQVRAIIDPVLRSHSVF
jgi:hypothetical protein